MKQGRTQRGGEERGRAEEREEEGKRGRGEGEGGGKGFQSKAMYEVDAGRDHATPAWVRHDADQPLTPISPGGGRARGGSGKRGLSFTCNSS